MGILGGAIGAGMGAVGSIFGGMAASKAMKQVKKNLEAQRRKNQEWYDRRYNEDSTQRADSQALLTNVEESILNRNKQATGAAAVMGGTNESVAAAKAQNNQALAQTATNIAVNGEARKDQIEASYMQNDTNIQDALNNLEQKKAANIASAVQGVTQAGANIAGLF